LSTSILFWGRCQNQTQSFCFKISKRPSTKNPTTLKKTGRSFEIQHILKEEYRFFVTEKDSYEKDYLKKVIIKFDVLFNTIVREKIINESIDKYIKYIRSYIPPKEG
jgi:hypothetical protein